jgi:hypothetical protein
VELAFLFSFDIGPHSVLPAIVSQLLPSRYHFKFVAAMILLPSWATNFPDILTMNVGSLIPKFYSM